MLTTPRIALLVALALVLTACRPRPAQTSEGSGSSLPATPCDATSLVGVAHVEVMIPYPGAEPSDVIDQAVYPVEAVVMGVPGVATIRSKAASDWGSVSVFFEAGVDAYGSTERVLEALQSARDALSPGVESPLVYGVEQASEGTIVLVTGDLPLSDLTTIADRLADRLVAVPGVRWAEAVGAGERQVVIHFDPARAAAYGILASDVEEAITNHSLDMPAGQIDVMGGSVLLPVAARTPHDDLGDVVVRMGPDGVPIRVGDVAEIEHTRADPEAVVTLDSRQAAAVMVDLGSTSPVDPNTGIAQTVMEVQAELPPDVRIEVVSSSDSAAIGVDLALPPGTSADDITSLVGELGRRAEAVPGIAHVISFSWIGRSSSTLSGLPATDDVGRLTLLLEPDADGSVVLAALRNELDSTPGAEVMARMVDSEQLTIALSGAEYEPLYDLAERLVETLRLDPSVAYAHTPDSTPQPETRLTINRGRAAALGLSTRQISDAIRLVGGPVEISRLFVGATQTPILLQIGQLDGDALDLSHHLLPGRGPSGEMMAVPLSELVSTTLTSTPAVLHRRNAEPTVWIEIDPTGDLGAACQSWLELVEEQASSVGVSYEVFVESSSSGGVGR